MNIYRVSCDPETCQTIMPVDESVWDTDVLMFDGLPKRDWVAPEMFVFNPLVERVGFFYLDPSVLVFDEGTMEEFADLFEMAGQILPLKVYDEQLFLLNVTQCSNSLDPESTSWKEDAGTGQRLSIRSYSFFEDRFTESSLFKIPETRLGEILTYSGFQDREDELFGRFQLLGLVGLEFELLYTSR